MDGKVNLNIVNDTNNLNNLNNLDYLNAENHENIENLSGDELNKKMEQMLATPEDAETIRQKKEKLYNAYLNQLALNSNYRKKNREKIRAYMAQLYSNPEYRENLKQAAENSIISKSMV